MIAKEESKFMCTNFSALLTKRKHNLRVLILLMIFCFEMEHFINVGNWSNQYLYLRVVFE